MKNKFNSNTFSLLKLVLVIFLLSNCKKEVQEKQQEVLNEETKSDIEIYELPAGSGNSIPSKTDLRDFCPPISNQGGTNMCVPFSLCALKSIHEQLAWGGSFSSEKTFSPSYIFNKIKTGDCNSGSNISTGLKLLKDEGVCNYKDFPYTGNCYQLPNYEQITKAAAFKINDFKKLNGITVSESSLKAKMKYLISQKQPIIVGVTIDEEFKNKEMFSWGDWVWRTNNSKKDNSLYHCVLVVGYDDNINAFLIMNSYGSAWKNQGYCWANYDFFVSRINNAFVTWDVLGPYTGTN